VLYHENIEIEKIAFILCSRKSLTMYSYHEASVVLFHFEIEVFNIDNSENRQSALSIFVKHSLDDQIRR